LYAPGNERVGIVAPVILDFYDHRTVVLSGGSTSMWSGRNVLNSKLLPFTDEWFESKRASNSTMIRRETIVDAGFMDDQLFSTSADEDYIRRMNQKGWTCHFVLAASIYHKVKPSENRGRQVGMTNPARAYILARNRTVLIRRYARWYQLAVYLLVWQHVFNTFYLYVLIFNMRKWAFVKAYLTGWLHAMRYVVTKKLPPLSYVLAMIG
jgi:GT2 family glycosyltransferase